MPTPFPPEEFLGFAKVLRSTSVPSSEGRWRTVCGRAYYAAFKATSNAICEKYGFDVDSVLPHETLCAKLASTTGDDEMREFGNTLNTLRLRRVHADYRLARPLSKEHEADAVKDSGEALDLLAKVRPRLPKITPTR